MISDKSSLLALGALFMKNKKLDKAETFFQKYTEICKDDYRGYFMLAKVYYLKENYVSSLELFDKSILLNSASNDSYGAAAAVAIKLNRPDIAADYCQKGLFANSADIACVYNLNIALRQLDKFQEAILLTRSVISEFVAPVRFQNVGISNPSPTVTIAILKWGSKYGPEYVNGIVNGIQKYASPELVYTVVCFTDDFSESAGLRADVEYRLLPELSSYSLSGWWYKAYLFSVDAGLTGRVVYFDLDTIFCSSRLNTLLLDCHPAQVSFRSAEESDGESTDVDDSDYRVESQSMFVLACLGAQFLSAEGRPCGVNSSVMIWNATSAAVGIGEEGAVYADHVATSPLHSLYTSLIENHDRILQAMYKFDHYIEYMFSSREEGKRSTRTDQLLHGVLCLQERFPGLFVDYNDIESTVLDDGTIPSAAAGVVCFPLHPKPHHIRDKIWVRKYWDTASPETSIISCSCGSDVSDGAATVRYCGSFVEEVD